ncbi:MAG: adenylyl-sulfate kinase [Vicinamibacterales bacterium]
MRDLVRICTLGSVDDGKSTLIGRLLHDTDSLPDDQIAAVRAATARHGSGLAFDYSLVTDGLKAEREQGITIDVAYRYFSTPRRAFIVADVPGHEQYTRNMATGASTAQLALLLVDATKGILPQTRRHAFIASLLGIPRLVVAVNKMDLVDHAEPVFDAIAAEFREFAARLGPLDLRLVPVVARDGLNLVTRDTAAMPWYSGEALLEILESIYVGGDRNLVDLRLPVQHVIRAPDGTRALAGPVVAGVVREGDELLVLPSRSRARVTSLTASAGGAEAFPPLAATLTLDRELDVGRGDLLVHPGNVPAGRTAVDAMVVWLDETPLAVGRRYLVKHLTRTVPARVERLHYVVDVNTLSRSGEDTLAQHGIGRLTLAVSQPLFVDPYARIRATGSFILLDPDTQATAAAGMVVDRGTPGRAPGEAMPRHVVREAPAVPEQERARRLGQRAVTVWLTGLSGSGKSTIARELERTLHDQGRHAFVLDGDTLRTGLNQDLGFSREDRAENVRRTAEVARVLNDAGLIAIVALISPFRDERERARQIVGTERFVEVYVDTPLDVCEARDAKGLYARARAGEIPEFTGISSPYEAPTDPALVLAAGHEPTAASVASLLACLEPRITGRSAPPAS